MGRKKPRRNKNLPKNNTKNSNSNLLQQNQNQNNTEFFEKHKDSLIYIDGSYGEGGGQVLRNSFALASVLGKGLNVNSIRAGRKTPGLRPQHLKGLELVREITNGKLHGAHVGSQEVMFMPNGINLLNENENENNSKDQFNDNISSSSLTEKMKKSFIADTQTAGSCTLLAQISLPVMLFESKATEVILKGGTNVAFSPPIDEIQKVFKPNVSKFGVDFNIETIRRGFYPKGGGVIKLSISSPVQQIHAAEILERGSISSIEGTAFVCGKIPQRSATNMIRESEKLLQKYIRSKSNPNNENSSSSSSKLFSSNVSFNIKEAKEPSNINSAFGLTLIAKTDTGCLFGSSGTSEKRSTDADVATKAVNKLIENIEHGGCVDEWVQDQLIIFMGLAKGYSRIRCGPLTEHTRTAIHFVELLTGAKFTIQEDKTTFPNTNIIECEGIGFVNRFIS